jgi:hypothetical protein
MTQFSAAASRASDPEEDFIEARDGTPPELTRKTTTATAPSSAIRRSGQRRAGSLVHATRACEMLAPVGAF